MQFLRVGAYFINLDQVTDVAIDAVHGFVEVSFAVSEGAGGTAARTLRLKDADADALVEWLIEHADIPRVTVPTRRT